MGKKRMTEDRPNVGSPTERLAHAPALGRCAKGGGNVRYREKDVDIYAIPP